MRMKVVERGPAVEVNLIFPDSRILDLDIALHFACEQNRWSVDRAAANFAQTTYYVKSRDTFLARAFFSHGMEPPTRATFDNRPSEDGNHWEAAKQSTIDVSRAFLDECANRLLITEKAKDKALKELSLVTISR